jgi:hypothetical protein
MTPPIFFLVLLLKHAGGNKRKVIHIKQPAVHAKPSAPRCGDKCMAARREAAYGPTAPKLQGCSPLPYPSLRQYLPRNITRPEAHPMETPRLADVWAAQKKMAARNGTAEAVVLGGSMPLGQGLRPGIAPWPARLQALLPNLNVDVRATRSTSSAWALGNLARLLPVCPDVVFMDYGVNDAAAIYNAFVPGSAGTGPAIEALSREAKRRCPAAALVHIEGAWNHGEKTREPTVPRLADAQRAVAARYGGIVISFIAGTCYQKTGWFEPHPPPAEHQRLAEQIATAWNAIDAARQAKAKGFGKGPWTLPPRVYNASAELDSCSVTTELASVEKGEKSFRRVDDASKSLWRYEEDVKGRPGFVIKTTPGAPFDATAATLRVRLKFSDRQATNTLRVEFLQTYENVGTATVWVGDHPATQRIDALDARDRFSTIGSASFRHGKNAQFEGGACNVTMTRTDQDGSVTTWYADGTKIKSKKPRSTGSKGYLSAKTCQQGTAFRYLDLPAGEGIVNVRLDALDARHREHAAVNKFKLVALAACDGKPP